ncbi:hypothetical protein ACFSR9_10085 [Deinococcus taklimakanensis]|uniref:Uncharacterized protein n=1 Tax=Deinococcus taklimakanensis TaxID=536443 RepID=A0ABW5P3N8_9DEIO
MNRNKPAAGLALAALLAGTADAANRMAFDGSLPVPSIFAHDEVPQADARPLAGQLKVFGAKVCGTPRIVARAPGHFASAAPETLYLIVNCGAYSVAAGPHRESAGDLVLVRSGRVVAYKKGFGDALSILPDLNGDHLQEFVSGAWFGPHMGEDGLYGHLWQFRRGKLNMVMGLGPVYRETGVGLPDSEPASVTVRTLWHDPARPNTLQAIDYRSPVCSACKTPEAPYDPSRARQVVKVAVDLRYPPHQLP